MSESARSDQWVGFSPKKFAFPFVWLFAIKVPVCFDHDCKDGDDECWGYWDNDNASLHVSSDIPLEAQRSVLFHELCEAAVDLGCENGDKEQIIRCCETGVWGALVDPRNEWLRSFLGLS